MLNRRILSLWFPRLGAERILRLQRGTTLGPFAVVRELNNMQVLSSLSGEAEAEGLFVGQPLRDAQAMCPGLLTRPHEPASEAAFLTVLRRWAGKFSPWVAEEPPASLVVDLTGCSHLFGGEEEILRTVHDDCAQHGLSVHAGIADTLGAAWALARFAGQPQTPTRSGDAIDQEARATRSRAARRRNWERGGTPPPVGAGTAPPLRISPPGQTRGMIARLPVAGLRLNEETVTGLARLGLRQIGDLAGIPRATLARRFGRDVVRRLDQASGVEPEPITPSHPEDYFAVRLTLPDPIGLEEDIQAGIDHLLPALSKRLKDKGRGARVIRLQAFRVDQASQVIEVGLARPSADPDRIRPLLKLKLGEIDAGFGIDVLRLAAVQTLPVGPTNIPGRILRAPQPIGSASDDTGLQDLIGKLGARIGLERILLGHPANSHIPEKAVTFMAAAWSEPSFDWPGHKGGDIAETPLRPLTLWRPEPVIADERPEPPITFRWRRRALRTLSARGPERIAPEWWLEDPEWRSGLRDYWQVTTDSGDRLWLFYAHGGAVSAGWFCQGAFA